MNMHRYRAWQNGREWRGIDSTLLSQLHEPMRWVLRSSRHSRAQLRASITVHARSTCTFIKSAMPRYASSVLYKSHLLGGFSDFTNFAPAREAGRPQAWVRARLGPEIFWKIKVLYCTRMHRN